MLNIWNILFMFTPQYALMKYFFYVKRYLQYSLNIFDTIGAVIDTCGWACQFEAWETEKCCSLLFPGPVFSRQF